MQLRGGHLRVSLKHLKVKGSNYLNVNSDQRVGGGHLRVRYLEVKGSNFLNVKSDQRVGGGHLRVSLKHM